jgi:hypothetical protein
MGWLLSAGKIHDSNMIASRCSTVAIHVKTPDDEITKSNYSLQTELPKLKHSK